MKILAYGEILWDVFDNNRKIGGAPLNFSAHIAKLGAQAYILSSVGNDSLGKDSLEQIKGFGVHNDFIIINEPFPTGICKVVCDEEGQPSYQLMENVAYDNIVVSDQIEQNINSLCFDAFYFGTLAQRNDVSQKSLVKLLSSCSFCEIFCDLNLRQSFYNKETIENCLKHCTILKISREEYKAIAELDLCDIKEENYTDCLDFYKDFSKDVANKFNIKIVIITLDKDGAFVYRKADGRVYNSIKPKNKAVSTVGAGDSFSACFLYNYLNSIELSECIMRAVMLSDFVVTEYEAVPNYTNELLKIIK